jgi:hypothetical protein
LQRNAEPVGRAVVDVDQTAVVAAQGEEADEVVAVDLGRKAPQAIRSRSASVRKRPGISTSLEDRRQAAVLPDSARRASPPP